MMLRSNVAERITAEEALDHPWFRSAPKRRLEHFNRVLPVMHAKSFGGWHQDNKFRNAAALILTEKLSLMSDIQKQSLEATFDTLDVDNDGLISIEDWVASLSSCEESKQDVLGEQRQDLREVFKDLDLDGRSINKRELMAAVVHNMVIAREERLHIAFEALDTDKS